MYLLLIILAAICSAVCKAIDSNFSVFKNWSNFWHPQESYGFNAVTIAQFLKFGLLMLAVVLSQFPWWQISFHKMAWHWQFVLVLFIYLGLVMILIETILCKPQPATNEKSA